MIKFILGFICLMFLIDGIKKIIRDAVIEANQELKKKEIPKK